MNLVVMVVFVKNAAGLIVIFPCSVKMLVRIRAVSVSGYRPPVVVIFVKTLRR